jgi:hypothetical protein
MKKILLTAILSLFFSAGFAQERKSAPAARTSTASISETNKEKIKEDIRKRREQNRAEMEKARKQVKERITADTLTRNTQ